MTFTYDAVGATAAAVRSAADEPRPAGFRSLRVSTRIGRGGAVFTAAAAALTEWRMHREMGVTMDTREARAVAGADVVVGLGAGRLRLHAPCRVVWSVSEQRSAGWAYGTLPGHPVSGEEAFFLSLEEDGEVRFTVLAFSRPDAAWTRAAGPLLRWFQRGYARRCGRVLAGIAQRETHPAA